MFSWLHNFLPQPILFQLGPVTVRWYGLFIVSGILSALAITLYLAKKFKIELEKIWDLSFYLVLFGILGARVYEVFLEFPYYLSHPVQVFKIWEGGLAIHGAIIAGTIVLFIFKKRYKLNFWQLAAIFTPGLVLGQAIGRFGNWFNQELFGLPTNLPWGIPISLENRPLNFISQTYFHPTFLYESLGCILISLFLFLILNRRKNLDDKISMRLCAWYLALYSILRFSLEFIKTDITPIILGLRLPQIISIIFVIIAILIYKKSYHA